MNGQTRAPHKAKNESFCIENVESVSHSTLGND